MEKVTGYVTGVNGNLVSARFSGSVRKNEVGFVKIGNDRLKGEVIRISGDAVSMQIYEMTNGIQVGDEVELTGELLSGLPQALENGEFKLYLQPKFSPKDLSVIGAEAAADALRQPGSMAYTPIRTRRRTSG